MTKANSTKKQKQSAPTASTNSRAELRIDWATHEAAKYAVENWHYSKTMPSPLSKPLKVGVWEGGEFIGCIIFTVGVSAALHSGYGVRRAEVCELQRVALRTHQNPVSRMIAIALRFLVNRCPKLKLVVSFADTHEGHHGGIYQAGNWIYSGVTSSTKAYYDKSGRQIHPRNVSIRTGYDKTGVKQYAKCELKEEHRPGKHRYLMPLDDEMRKQIEPLRKPYPKRVRSVDSDTPQDH